MLTPRGQQEGKKTRNRRHTRRCRKGPVCSMHKLLQDFPGLKKTLRSHCVVRSNGRVKKDPVHSWFPVMSPGSVCGCYCDHKPRTQCVCVCSFCLYFWPINHVCCCIIFRNAQCDFCSNGYVYLTLYPVEGHFNSLLHNLWVNTFGEFSYTSTWNPLITSWIKEFLSVIHRLIQVSWITNTHAPILVGKKPFRGRSDDKEKVRPYLSQRAIRGRSVWKHNNTTIQQHTHIRYTK